MSEADSTRRLSKPAARYLVSMMWPPRGATWFEVQRWFVRMWGAGDPGAEDEVRSGLESAVKALKHLPGQPDVASALEPRELAEHWTNLIAAALDEQRFSPQALLAFMEEFQVPAGIAAQLMWVEREIRSLKRRERELANQNAHLWETIQESGKEASRQDRNELSDRLENKHRANQADRALRTEASKAYSAARSQLRAAEHKLSVFEQQHAAGRRTDAELDEARENKRAAEESQKWAKAELDRIDQENSERKEQRRQEPTALGEHHSDVARGRRTTAAIQAEQSELLGRKAELEAKASELRKVYRRQDYFYEQKRDAVRQRDRDERDQARRRKREEEKRKAAEKADLLREEALNDPSAGPHAPPQSPEVQRWLYSLSSLDGWADPPRESQGEPSHPDPLPSEPADSADSAAPEPDVLDSATPHETDPLPSEPHSSPAPPEPVESGEEASDVTEPANEGSAPSQEHDPTNAEKLMLTAASRLAQVTAGIQREVAHYRELPDSASSVELREAAGRIRLAWRKLSTRQSESDALYRKLVADAQEFQQVIDISLDHFSFLSRGVASSDSHLDDLERIRDRSVFHAPERELMERTISASQDVVLSHEVLSAAAEQVAQAKHAVESAQDVLWEARGRGDLEEITATADILRRARSAHATAQMESETALARLDQTEQLLAHINAEISQAMPESGAEPEYDPDAELRRLQQPPDDEGGPNNA